MGACGIVVEYGTFSSRVRGFVCIQLSAIKLLTYCVPRPTQPRPFSGTGICSSWSTGWRPSVADLSGAPPVQLFAAGIVLLQGSSAVASCHTLLFVALYMCENCAKRELIHCGFDADEDPDQGTKPDSCNCTCNCTNQDTNNSTKPESCPKPDNSTKPESCPKPDNSTKPESCNCTNQGTNNSTKPESCPNQRDTASRLTLNWLSTSTVIYSYRPPADSDYSKVIKYTSKYHKQGDSDWTTLDETNLRYQTVNNLDQDTIYEFIVDAKYEHGQEVTPALQPLLVRTDTGQIAPRLYAFCIPS